MITTATNNVSKNYLRTTKSTSSSTSSSSSSSSPSSSSSSAASKSLLQNITQSDFFSTTELSNQFLTLSNDSYTYTKYTETHKTYRRKAHDKLISLITTNQITFDDYKKKIYTQLIENEQHLRYIERTQIGTHCPKLTKCVQDTSLPNYKAKPCDSVFFFDIDNCLYSKHLKIDHILQIYIRKYFQNVLNIKKYEDAKNLNERYYKEYGLAIKGLLKEHPEIDIDPIEYNQMVDDALPLQDLIKPNPKLRSILLDLKKSGKVDKLWLFTNAYKNHGIRVVKLLGIADLFDGITYCNYSSEENMVCKPHIEAYKKAMFESGIKNWDNAYFIDDSRNNIKAADKLNFKKAILIDQDFDDTQTSLETNDHSFTVVNNFDQLKTVVPELF